MKYYYSQDIKDVGIGVDQPSNRRPMIGQCLDEYTVLYSSITFMHDRPSGLLLTHPHTLGPTPTREVASRSKVTSVHSTLRDRRYNSDFKLFKSVLTIAVARVEAWEIRNVFAKVGSVYHNWLKVPKYRYLTAQIDC